METNGYNETVTSTRAPTIRMQNSRLTSDTWALGKREARGRALSGFALNVQKRLLC